MARQRPDQEKEELVRSALKAATKMRANLEALLDMMRTDGFDIKSPAHTVQKFKSGERSLQTGDLEKMFRYFHGTDYGQVILKRAGIASRKIPANILTTSSAPLPQRIAAASPPRPENLTGSIRLASILIEGTQWGRGTVCTSITVACADWHGCAVQRGRVEMDPHPGRLADDGINGLPEAIVVTAQGYGRTGQVAVARGCSTAYDPFWDVTGIGMPIGRFTTDGDFAPLEGLSPGTNVTVTFGTWLGDIEPMNSAPDAVPGDDTSATDGLALVNADKSDSRMTDPKGYKRRLISIIRSTALNARPDGYVELSKCTLEIVEG